jgi:hypothetical protein
MRPVPAGTGVANSPWYPARNVAGGPLRCAQMEAEENKVVTQAVPPLALLAAIVVAGTLTLGWITLLLWLVLKALSLM